MRCFAIINFFVFCLLLIPLVWIETITNNIIILDFRRGNPLRKTLILAGFLECPFPCGLQREKSIKVPEIGNMSGLLRCRPGFDGKNPLGTVLLFSRPYLDTGSHDMLWPNAGRHDNTPCKKRWMITIVYLVNLKKTINTIIKLAKSKNKLKK